MRELKPKPKIKKGLTRNSFCAFNFKNITKTIIKPYFNKKEGNINAYSTLSVKQNYFSLSNSSSTSSPIVKEGTALTKILTPINLSANEIILIPPVSGMSKAHTEKEVFIASSLLESDTL